MAERPPHQTSSRPDAARWTTIGRALRAFVDRWRRPEPPPPATSAAEIEAVTGAPVGNLDLYRHALRHRSLLRDHPQKHLASNERLEVLGDAVLGLIVAEHLYAVFGDRDEGFLTRMRSKLVNGAVLAEYARALELGTLVQLSENMERAGGRDNPSILADAFEAIVGALYLDQGLIRTRRFVLDTIDDLVDLSTLAERRENYKSVLLEYAQARGWAQPRYRVVWERGPSHEREFCVEVVISGRPYEQGTARSKKKAEQKAAARTLKLLRQTEAP